MPVNNKHVQLAYSRSNSARGRSGRLPRARLAAWRAPISLAERRQASGERVVGRSIRSFSAVRVANLQQLAGRHEGRRHEPILLVARLRQLPALGRRQRDAFAVRQRVQIRLSLLRLLVRDCAEAGATPCVRVRLRRRAPRGSRGTARRAAHAAQRAQRAALSKGRRRQRAAGTAGAACNPESTSAACWGVRDARCGNRAPGRALCVCGVEAVGLGVSRDAFTAQASGER